MKHIALNGGIYFHVDTEQQKKLKPLLRPILRTTTDACHTCACYTDKIVFNATISEMQCLDCFKDWSRGYNLSKEDYKRQAYTAESVERILNKD
jgi:hypothetical protein